MTHVTTFFGRLYLGNKMTGVPYLNAPWFDQTADRLRKVQGVSEVFNPAAEDRKLGLDPMLCPNGSQQEAEEIGGLGIRKSLTYDLHWISCNSNGMIIGPAWFGSKGTITEIAFHQALRLPVWEDSVFFDMVQGHPDNLFRTCYQFPQLSALLV